MSLSSESAPETPLATVLPDLWAQTVNNLLGSPSCTLSVRSWADGGGTRLENKALQGVYLTNAKGLPFNKTEIGGPLNYAKYNTTEQSPYWDGNFYIDVSGLLQIAKWGASRASRATYVGFHGVCDGCAAIAAGVLLANAANPGQGSATPQGLLVEQLGRGSRSKQNRHTFLLVGRRALDPSNERPGKEYKTWGEGCYIIDHWWALQRGSVPSMFLVGSEVFLMWEADMNLPVSVGKEGKTSPAYAYAGDDPERKDYFVVDPDRIKPLPRINWGTGKYDIWKEKYEKEKSAKPFDY
jgi:hypothetical protein